MKRIDIHSIFTFLYTLYVKQKFHIDWSHQIRFDSCALCLQWKSKKSKLFWSWFGWRKHHSTILKETAQFCARMCICHGVLPFDAAAADAVAAVVTVNDVMQ